MATIEQKRFSNLKVTVSPLWPNLVVIHTTDYVINVEFESIPSLIEELQKYLKK